MRSSSQVRMPILSGEVEYIFLVWMNSEESRERLIYQQAIIKLLSAYSFRNIFFIGQNLKHGHMVYSFLELLIFFWLILVIIYCFEFISHYITTKIPKYGIV